MIMLNMKIITLVNNINLVTIKCVLECVVYYEVLFTGRPFFHYDWYFHSSGSNSSTRSVREGEERYDDGNYY